MLGAILAFALAVRLMQAYEGLPYLHHFDEPQVASTALQIMRSGDLNPHFFNYGSLLIYMNLGVDVLHYYHLMGQPEENAGSLGALDDIRTEHDTGWHWTISHPSFYLWNRWLTALFGAGSVALVYFIGRAVGGGWAGLLAAAFLAGLPLHVEYSAYVTTDVPASFLSIATVLLSVRHLQEGRPGQLLAALACGGLAASTKYNAAVVLSVPLAAFLLSLLSRRAVPRPWLWAALPAVPAVAFLIGTPCALLDLRQFLIDVGTEVRHYGVLGHGTTTTTAPGWPHLAWQAGMISSTLGIPVTLLAVLGAVSMLARRAGWLVLLHPVLYALFMAGQRVKVERNLVVLYAFAAIAAGAGAMALVRVAAALALPHSKARRWVAVAVPILIAILVLIPGAQAASIAWRAFRVPEPRSQALLAAARLAAKAPPPARVGIAEEMRAHPLDLARIGASATVKPWLDLVCDPAPYSVILRPGRFTGFRGEAKPTADMLKEMAPAGFAAVESFGLGPLFLDLYSTMPLVELLVPSTESSTAGTWTCQERFASSDLKTSMKYAIDPNGTLQMTKGGWALTPPVRAGAGRYAFVLLASGQGAGGEPARLHLTVEDASAEKTLLLEQDRRDYVLGFEVAQETALSLRVAFVNDFWSPKNLQDRNAYLGRIVLLHRRSR
ncbi:MAG TPA: glycosyltransferase family 39 protein [Candidatus Polarisedimenticolia bacterium]|jgi:hypothetical protein